MTSVVNSNGNSKSDVVSSSPSNGASVVNASNDSKQDLTRYLARLVTMKEDKFNQIFRGHSDVLHQCEVQWGSSHHARWKYVRLHIAQPPQFMEKCSNHVYSDILECILHYVLITLPIASKAATAVNKWEIMTDANLIEIKKELFETHYVQLCLIKNPSFDTKDCQDLLNQKARIAVLFDSTLGRVPPLQLVAKHIVKYVKEEPNAFYVPTGTVDDVTRSIQQLSLDNKQGTTLAIKSDPHSLAAIVAKTEQSHQQKAAAAAETAKEKAAKDEADRKSRAEKKASQDARQRALELEWQQKQAAEAAVLKAKALAKKAEEDEAKAKEEQRLAEEEAKKLEKKRAKRERQKQKAKEDADAKIREQEEARLDQERKRMAQEEEARLAKEAQAEAERVKKERQIENGKVAKAKRAEQLEIERKAEELAKQVESEKKQQKAQRATEMAQQKASVINKLSKPSPSPSPATTSMPVKTAVPSTSATDSDEELERVEKEMKEAQDRLQAAAQKAAAIKEQRRLEAIAAATEAASIMKSNTSTTEKKTKFDVWPEMKISELKEMIREHLGIPFEEQVFHYKDRELNFVDNHHRLLIYLDSEDDDLDNFRVARRRARKPILTQTQSSDDDVTPKSSRPSHAPSSASSKRSFTMDDDDE